MKQEETRKELNTVRIGNTTDVFDAVRKTTTDVEGNAPVGEKGVNC